MLKKLQQLNRLWKLTKKDPEYLKAIEGLSHEEIENIPNKGNGKGSFIPMMSDGERNEYLKNQEPVWKKFNDRLKEIIK
jgi:hypothetical protein